MFGHSAPLVGQRTFYQVSSRFPEIETSAAVHASDWITGVRCEAAADGIGDEFRHCIHVQSDSDEPRQLHGTSRGLIVLDSCRNRIRAVSMSPMTQYSCGVPVQPPRDADQRPARRQWFRVRLASDPRPAEKDRCQVAVEQRRHINPRTT